MTSNRSGGSTSGMGDHDDWQPLDPNADDGASEFSWGSGLTPRGLEDAPVSEGGRYQGQSPPSERRVSVSRDQR